MEQDVADQGALAHLVDARLIREPRLRSLVGMDLKAVQRASRAGDFRLVAVLLRSLLCAVAWDAALQRRRELGLKGGPDTWRLPDVVTALLGAELSSSDAMQVSALDRASELLHPPAQLIRPQVVTRATVDGFLELVGRLSRSLTVPAQ